MNGKCAASNVCLTITCSTDDEIDEYNIKFKIVIISNSVTSLIFSVESVEYVTDVNNE